MSLALALHALAAVLWVGGMAFAHLMLRPAAAALPPPARFALWRGVLGRFFPAVWGAVALLLATGYGAVAMRGGFAAIGPHVHVMQATGIAMMLVFAHVFFAPWRRFRAAVAAGRHEEAGRHLGLIRRLVTVNLVLGVITVAAGASGRWWG